MTARSVSTSGNLKVMGPPRMARNAVRAITDSTKYS